MKIANINGKTVFPICINLLRSPERKKNIQNQMESVNFPVNFCEGIDRKYMLDDATGSNIRVELVTLVGGDGVEGITKPTNIRYKSPSNGESQVFHYIPPGMIRSRYVPYTTVLYLGTVGCSLSHLKCFELFDKSNCDYGLILEDDVDLVCKDQGFLQKRISECISHSFDLFLIGSGFHRDYFPNPKGYSSGDTYETGFQWYSGSSAYLISRRGLDKIKSAIPNYQTVFSAADEFFGLCQQDLNCTVLSTQNKVFRLHETLVETTMIDHHD